MIRMRCEDCGTVYYSAAAKTMVEHGEPCPKCGGRLVIDDAPGQGARPIRTARTGRADSDDDDRE
jgi:predicted  nucleic acid-binding Zn-ribbon protein